MEQVLAKKLKGSKIVTKNIIIFLTGHAVSLLGSTIYSFAISLYILKVTGSALNFALSFALGVLPRVLFGPISGVFTDRFNRKTIIVLLDVISGLIVLSLLGLSMIDSLRIEYIYVTTFLLATASTFFSTALNASIPNIVNDEKLTTINSLNEAFSAFSQIAGPFLGAIVYAFIDIRFFLLINGLSFLISGFSEAFINFRVKKDYFTEDEELNSENSKPKQKNSFFADLKEGFTYIMTQRWLVILGLFVVFFNMFTIMGLTIPVPHIVVNRFGFTEFQYGILNTMFPLGMFIASIFLGLLPQKKKIYKRMMTSIFIFSIIILLVGIVTSEYLMKLNNSQYLIILVSMYLIMATMSILINVPIGVTMQKLIPNDKLGRVEGTLGTLAGALTPVGAIAAGLLIDKVNPAILPIISGIIMIILALIMSRVKDLKSI